MTSGEVHLRDLALAQHSSGKRRSVGDIASDLTSPGIELQTSRTDSDVLTIAQTGRFLLYYVISKCTLKTELT